MKHTKAIIVVSLLVGLVVGTVMQLPIRRRQQPAGIQADQLKMAFNCGVLATLSIREYFPKAKAREVEAMAEIFWSNPEGFQEAVRRSLDEDLPIGFWITNHITVSNVWIFTPMRRI